VHKAGEGGREAKLNLDNLIINRSYKRKLIGRNDAENRFKGKKKCRITVETARNL
jgi:hypothetical protein